MSDEEADLLNDIFANLEENDGTPELEILEALTKLSATAKAEFVRRMDAHIGFIPSPH